MFNTTSFTSLNWASSSKSSTTNKRARTEGPIGNTQPVLKRRKKSEPKPNPNDLRPLGIEFQKASPEENRFGFLIRAMKNQDKERFDKVLHRNQVQLNTRDWQNEIDFRDQDPETGHTLLTYALSTENPESRKYFVESFLALMPGLKDLADRNQRTPLHWAAKQGDFALGKQFIVPGVSAEAKDYLGQTPLHKAVMGNNPRFVKALILRVARDARAATLRTDNSFDEAQVRQKVVEYVSQQDKVQKSPVTIANEKAQTNPEIKRTLNRIISNNADDVIAALHK